MWKTIGIILGGLAGAIILVFVLNLAGLEMFKFFEPKKEDARREVFENTKSYVQGAEADLAKLYREYNESDDDGKETIKEVVRMKYDELDETKIDNLKLKKFLTDMRGF